LATLAFNRYQSDRQVAFAGAQPRGEHHGQQLNLRGEYGRRYPLGENLGGRLLGALQYAWLHESGYSESGTTGAELVVADSDIWTLRSSLGGQLDWNDRSGAGWRTFHARAVWLHDFNDDAPSLSASFGGQGSGFTTYGDRPARDGLGIGLGMSYTTPSGTRLKLGYEGEFRSGYQGHALTAQAGWGGRAWIGAWGSGSRTWRQMCSAGVSPASFI